MARLRNELPIPVPGLVIRFNYLWALERQEGLAVGRKDRPCAIVVHHRKTGDTIVVPITHAPPEPGEEHLSIAIPPDLCRELNLDDLAQWVRISEVNRFTWPGPYVKPRPLTTDRFEYGMIPPEFFEAIRDGLHAAMRSTRLPATRR